jgi:uncharacterized pyridoxamine 5'-phosphate oxidase family protein/Pyruvate/2-oxoacid:ferredoxin oxidoreductase delta subunit
MELKDCLKILREMKDVSFATVDSEGNPQVRIIDVMDVTDDTLYFLTARGKNFYHEINLNKKVSIVCLTPDFKSIRVQASVNRVDNQKEMIDKIFQLNPSMNTVYPSDSRYILEAFYLTSGEVELFDLSCEPVYRESFSLNGGVIKPKGFKITQDCLECGLCYENCPQKAIVEDSPFKIKQRHCLHCGLCYENCPNSAIIRKE